VILQCVCSSIWCYIHMCEAEDVHQSENLLQWTYKSSWCSKHVQITGLAAFCQSWQHYMSTFKHYGFEEYYLLVYNTV
jgi:hypothetical protein